MCIIYIYIFIYLYLLNRIDIRLVALERLNALARPNIPVLCSSVARAAHKGIFVGRDRDAHDIAAVVRKLRNLASALDVPQDAGHVAAGGEDLRVVNEPAAADVARVARELAVRLDGDVAGAEVIDGAHVVEAAARHKHAGRRVGAGHHPGRAQGDGVDLVGCDAVPHNKLAVLRGAHEMVGIGGPVHGVDLREMPLQRPPDLDLVVFGQRRDVSRHILHCKKKSKIENAMHKKKRVCLFYFFLRVVSFLDSLFVRISSLILSTSLRSFWIFSVTSDPLLSFLPIFFSDCVF